MQRVVPAVMGVMIASVGFTAIAPAADIPQGYAMPAPVTSLYNWTGFYVGGQGGYSWGTFDVNPRGADIDGWFAGGQIGFNWQNGRSPWVFGIEVDSAFGDIERDVDRITTNSFASAYSKVNYFGTARVRVGYAIDRAMIYGTGGLAWAHSEIGLYANVNGYLVEREDEAGRLIDDDRLTGELSDRLVNVWSAIKDETMSAAAIRQCVIPFSVDVQLDQHFARHRQLIAGQAA